MSRLLSFPVFALTIAGCQTAATNYERPARIVAPDDASRAALQETVNAAFDTEVTLADSALTDSSLLTIVRDPPRTMDNPVPQGRAMERPIQFRLVKNGNDCVLVNQWDQSRYVLAETRCVTDSD